MNNAWNDHPNLSTHQKGIVVYKYTRCIYNTINTILLFYIFFIGPLT